VRFRDLLGLALSALWQQKVRTLLTTLGVVFGSFVLVASLAVRWGADAAILREYSRFGELRKIDVNPSYASREEDVPADKQQVQGRMSAERRQRLHKQLVERWQRSHGRSRQSRLSAERIYQLASLEHVRAVEPAVFQGAQVELNGHLENTVTLGVRPRDEQLTKRLVAGTDLDAAAGRECLVSEFLLYRLGIVDEADMAHVVGRRLRLTYHSPRPAPSLLVLLLRGQRDDVAAGDEKLLEKVVEQLPAAVAKLDLTPPERAAMARLLRKPPPTPKALPEVTFAEDFTIRGVVRAPADMEVQQRAQWGYQAAEVFLPIQTAQDLFLRLPQNREAGFESAVVEVDSINHVKEVNEAIRATGLNTWNLVELIEREQLIYLLVLTATTVVAATSLINSALGMTNTMVMSVLERVREIGIMKAVGARDRHVQLVFLVEGALVGLVGGLLGLALGWAASFPGDAWVHRLVQRRLSLELHGSIFAFPWWLVTGAPAFACLVTTVAAVYPAYLAARVNPVTALRHD
jgi:putative ABC transport system permease protein